MKKKNTFTKFETSKLKETKEIKGGIRAAPDMPGGSGGSSWIDRGDMDARNDFGQKNIIKNDKLIVTILG